MRTHLLLYTPPVTAHSAGVCDPKSIAPTLSSDPPGLPIPGSFEELIVKSFGFAPLDESEFHSGLPPFCCICCHDPVFFVATRVNEVVHVQGAHTSLMSLVKTLGGEDHHEASQSKQGYSHACEIGYT